VLLALSLFSLSFSLPPFFLPLPFFTLRRSGIVSCRAIHSSSSGSAGTTISKRLFPPVPIWVGESVGHGRRS